MDSARIRPATNVVPSRRPCRVIVLGATGTIGQATVRALVARGHEVDCLVRPRPGPGRGPQTLPQGATPLVGDVTDAGAVRHAFQNGGYDAAVSCLASRTGAPQDAWAIDHRAHVSVLGAARATGVTRMVLLSAICVQRPMLAFQHAKLAFESELRRSGLVWTIVRPTAYFKSLSGQIARVRAGKPYLIFGDGRLTACKPIADDDLGAYLADCLDDQDRCNRILPIGGPGNAITPREQGEAIFSILGRAPRFRQVPVALLDGIARTLSALGRVSPEMARKAELARIGRYYATQSMLVLDPVTGRYDADATPSTGARTLLDHYRGLIDGTVADQRGDHAVF